MGDACSKACGKSSGRPEPEEGVRLRPELRAAMAGQGAELTPSGAPKLTRELSKAGEKCLDCDGWGVLHHESSDEEGDKQYVGRTECPAWMARASSSPGGAGPGRG